MLLASEQRRLHSARGRSSSSGASTELTFRQPLKFTFRHNRHSFSTDHNSIPPASMPQQLFLTTAKSSSQAVRRVRRRVAQLTRLKSSIPWLTHSRQLPTG